MPFPSWSRRRRIAVGAMVAAVGGLGALLLGGLGRDPWPPRVEIAATRDDSFEGFSRDGRSLSLSGPVGQVWYDAATGRPQPTGEGSAMSQRSETRDRRSYVEVDLSGEGVVWRDAATRSIRQRFPTPGSQPWHVAFADGDRLIRAVLAQKGPPEPMSGVDPDGSTWHFDLARPEIKEVATWDVATGAMTGRPVLGKFDQVADYSPDGRLLADFQMNGSVVQVYDLLADQPLGQPIPVGGDTAVFVGMLHQPAPIHFTPAGHLVIGQPGGLVELWHPGDPRPIRVIQAHPGGFDVRETVVSPDGRTLASFAYDVQPARVAWFWAIVAQVAPSWQPTAKSELVVVDLTTGRVLARSAQSSGPHFSPDGRTVVTREPDGRFAIRDVPQSSGR